MPAVQLKPGVHWVGVNDHTTRLFEGLWPIEQEGICYNSYIIRDEQTALIDLVKLPQAEDFLSNLAPLADLAEVDYVIVNHLEPDHSGLLLEARRHNPGLTIVGSERMAEMLGSFLGITRNVRAVQDGETLSLGETTLRFLMTPFVHWPETMMTYDEGRRILFSGDAFGGYGHLKGALFDDEAPDLDFYEQEALRYFANVIAKFHRSVLKALDRLEGLEIDILASTHALCWRGEPRRMIELYRKWSRYGSEAGEPAATMVYGTMYGYTEGMADAVAQGVASEGVALEVFNAGKTHVSYILPALWRRAGLIVGAPTYEGGLFPPVRQALEMAAEKAVAGKKAAFFGSFGWAGGAERYARELLEPLDSALIESLTFCGRPTPQKLAEGREFGARFARALKGG